MGILDPREKEEHYGEICGIVHCDEQALTGKGLLRNLFMKENE